MLNLSHRKKYFIQRAGPRLWNEIPDEVKECGNIEIYTKKSKIYLFGTTELHYSTKKRQQFLQHKKDVAAFSCCTYPFSKY